MKTVAFYSYKGGAGRTLLLANLATYLAQVGMKVVAVDFDLEAPGLHYKLRPTLRRDPGAAGLDPIVGAEVAVSPGVVGYITDTLRAGHAPDSLDPYMVNITDPDIEPAGGSLSVIPAGLAPSNAYWESMLALDWPAMSTGQRPVAAAVLLELHGQIAATGADYLLIDSRTGVTDANAIAIRTLADHVVGVAVPNSEHLDGLLHALASLREGEQSAPQTLVLSRLPSRSSRAFRFDQTTDWASLLRPAVPESVSVLGLTTDERLQSGEFLHLAGWNRSGTSDLARDYLAVIQALFPEVGGAADRVIEARVEAILASWARRTSQDLVNELTVLAQATNHWAAWDGLARIERFRDAYPEPALRALEPVVLSGHLGKATQTVPVLEMLVQRKQTLSPTETRFVDAALEQTTVEAGLAAELRALVGSPVWSDGTPR